MLNSKFLKFDIAFVLAAIPHLIHIKIPVLTFIIFCLLLGFLKTKLQNILLVIIGVIGFLIVWFSYEYELTKRVILLYNILSFIGMVFLVLGTTLRLGEKRNIFLYLSPFFMMLFALHYFNKEYMMLYVFFYCYAFLTLYLWEKQDNGIKQAIKYVNKMFLAALPIFILLFLFYPRNESEPTKRLESFKEEETVSGFEGSISMKNSGSVTPSSEKAFEVWFDEKIPEMETFYFRGSVLYSDRFGNWKPRLNRYTKGTPKVDMSQKQYEYTIYLFPHGQKWLYSLDYLSNTLKGTEVYKDRTLLADKEIDSAFRYKLWSTFTPVKDTLTKQEQNSYLLQDKRVAPKLYENTKKIRAVNDPVYRTKLLLDYIRSLKLGYTLDPIPITEKSAVDDFFYSAKEGYCVHFASSVATASQLVGIPSRVVTGFIAYPEQKVGNYLLIEQKNAHAWVEIYLENHGWVRIEATSLAKGEVNLNGLRKEGIDAYIEKALLYVQYILHAIQEKLLEIEEYFKLDFLKELFEKIGVLIPILVGVLLLLIIGYLLELLSINKRGHEFQLKRFLELAKKYGYKKLNGETVEAFIKRVSKDQQEEIKEILLKTSTYYNEWVYGEIEESKEKFLQMKKKLSKVWKK